MAKIQCYNCKKVTPVVAPKYRCKFCNYPLNKYIEQENEPSEEVIIEKIKQDEPADPSINEVYRQNQFEEEPKPNVNLETVLEKLNQYQNEPTEKPAEEKPNVVKESTKPVVIKQNLNPDKKGKIVAGWLIVHTEDKDTVTYELFEGRNIIGRPDGPHQVDIRVEDDEYVSRVHAVIVVEKDFLHRFNYQLFDDGSLRGGSPSTNGTYVNGIEERLSKGKPVFLRDCDTVQVGTTKLVFKNIDAADSDESAAISVHHTDFVNTVAIRKFRK